MKRQRMAVMVVVVAVLGVLMGPWSGKSVAGDFKASDPQPPDGASGVLTPLLQWTPGADAVRHEVYFGTDESDVVYGTGGTFKGTLTTPVYDPGTLALGTRYYWRIDELGRTGQR